MNRFKDYRFWTALAGAVVILLNALGECFGFSVDNDLVSGIIMAIAGILVVFGVVSKPKENQKEEDSKSEYIDNNAEDKNDVLDESKNQKHEQINQEEQATNIEEQEKSKEQHKINKDEQEICQIEEINSHEQNISLDEKTPKRTNFS